MLPLARRRTAHGADAHPREDGALPQPEGGGLARRPRRPAVPRPRRPRGHAPRGAALRRAHGAATHLRAHPVHDPQARGARAHPARRRQRLLRGELLVEDRRLQGPHAAGPAPCVLHGSRRRRREQQARARALPVLDQHVPHLGAGAPLPADRPQRRDQHPPRQPELDERARGPARVAGVRRAPRRHEADHPPRRQRLGLARQRRRLPHRERALDSPT